jgi:hypothetical protein
MKEPEQLSAWLAEAMLKSRDENIAALDVFSSRQKVAGQRRFHRSARFASEI